MGVALEEHPELVAQEVDELLGSGLLGLVVECPTGHPTLNRNHIVEAIHLHSFLLKQIKHTQINLTLQHWVVLQKRLKLRFEHARISSRQRLQILKSVSEEFALLVELVTRGQFNFF